MVVLGPVHLIAFGFPEQQVLPQDVARRLHQLRGRRIIRLDEVLYVSRDERGRFRVCHAGVDPDARSDPITSSLWQLLDGEDLESLPSASFTLDSWGDVGLDLATVEGIADRIEPGTSALLVLLEPMWTAELLDAVRMSGGFPIVFGCLEAETMLILGPQLASASATLRVAERTASAHGAAMLDALRSAPAPSTRTADVIRALLAAGLVHDYELETVSTTLAAAGLVPRSSVESAVEQADAAVAEIADLTARGELE
jgi:uncharacterized membrane protein